MFPSESENVNYTENLTLIENQQSGVNFPQHFKEPTKLLYFFLFISFSIEFYIDKLQAYFRFAEPTEIWFISSWPVSHVEEIVRLFSEIFLINIFNLCLL